MITNWLSSNIVGIICSVLTPYMLNPSAWNWANFAGFFWVCPSFPTLPQDPDLTLTNKHLQGGICFCCIIYTYFRVPEPQGRSFAELDMLFERGVSARKFPTTDIDVFGEEVDSGVIFNYKEKSDIHH
jgi:SP family general alpha glucoside:H+ symporter-like MFS transporter